MIKLSLPACHMDRTSPTPRMEGQGPEAFCRSRRDEGDGDVRQGFAALNMHESLGMTREEGALALIIQASQNQR